MSTEFRKRENVWHWCAECSEWPSADFEVALLATGTPEGETCPQCRELDLAQKCTRQS
jgi:hypothetical protein